VSVVIVGVIRRKPVLTHASIVCEGMLASVNSVNNRNNQFVHIEGRPEVKFFTLLLQTEAILVQQRNGQRWIQDFERGESIKESGSRARVQGLEPVVGG